MAVNGNAWANGSDTHDARVLRNLAGAIFQQPMIAHANALAPTTRGGAYGVVGTRELLVTSTGSLGYSIAPGRVVATGTFATAQGTYVGYNDAAVAGSLAAHSAFIRHDLICYRVRDGDEDASGGEDDSFAVVQGISASTDPAIPSSLGSLVVLARATVPATSGTPTFTDLRRFATTLGGTHRCTSATRPTGEALYEGQRIYEVDSNTELINTSATTTAAWEIVSEPLQAWNVTALTQSPGTVAFTTHHGNYQRSRGRITAYLSGQVSAVGTGTASAGVTIPTPVTLPAQGGFPDTGWVTGNYYYQNPSSGLLYTGIVYPATTTSIGLIPVPGITVSSGHILILQFLGAY
jgi:hypothetical protein